MERVVILHNIRSKHNVGSIFRTADAAGVRQIFLTGYTPTPLDRYGRPQKEIIKTALGAEQTIAWEQHDAIEPLLKTLREQGFAIVGVELDPSALDYRSWKPDRSVALIFGNEVEGIAPTLRDQCDQLIEIPMRGTKESLNVSVAAGIILFAF
jgi:tRNA G18 (ribose-2'-O)-methylase SpoU